ncbi:MAG: aminopeptidase [Mycobacteriaceae bacterium]|nr:aminopeptidase [Mycobacteriaceae bacterium]
MTLRRLLLLVGAVLLVAGIIALLVPVSVSGNNGSVGCGVPIAGGDLNAARDKDSQNPSNAAGSIPVVGPVVQSVAPPSHYEADCNSAIQTRLWWAIPIAVIGIVVIAGSLLVRDGRRAGARPGL